jgi:dTDP-3,4-didehydro-2,6-dideoxy-alpha-D-glucose 3-reductase
MACLILKREVLYHLLNSLNRMDTILFIGYSNLIKTRIFPILWGLGFKTVHIAKYINQNWDDDYKKYDFQVMTYDSYEEGIQKYSGNLVYISTVNSSHFEIAKRCLLHNKNVIIDKPSTTSYVEATELVEIAKKRNLLLSESIVYLKHPQFNIVKGIFKDYNDSPKLITAHFTMPPFKNTNFRYKKELGGGAILDTSPYAISIGRYFFNEKPSYVKTIINEKYNTDLEIEYSLIMMYSNGKCLIGHFGFNTEYINQITIMGNRTNVFFNRVFTIPEDLHNEIVLSHYNSTNIIRSSAGNTFRLYFLYILECLLKGNYTNCYNDLLYDAEVRTNIIINKVDYDGQN